MNINEHDTGYKLIFSYKEMIRDLIRGYIDDKWVDDIDDSTFEDIKASFVTNTGLERHDDMVWKVSLGGETMYIYILLEFQSTSDRWMAPRLQTYIGMLYEDLIRGKQLSKDGKLPLVFPLVLYVGSGKWNAATNLSDIVVAAPKSLKKYQPTLTYFLVDINNLDHSPSDPARRNLVDAIFGIELSRGTEEFRNLTRRLAVWVSGDEQSLLRRDLTAWVIRKLRSKVLGETIPDLVDLMEVDKMLAENNESWTETWKRQGMAQGMEQGMEIGMEKGMEKGERKTLRLLLKKRFGDIPAAMLAQIDAASLDKIEVWFELAIDADSLAAVFGMH